MMRLLRDGTHADVAELADALDSGSSDRKVMQVQVLSSAYTKSLPRFGGRFFVCADSALKKGFQVLEAFFLCFWSSLDFSS